MDETPTAAAQDIFDRLQQELEGASDEAILTLELLFEPKGRKTRIPTLILQRDEPVFDQLVEHLRTEGAGPGKYRVRLRFGRTGKMGPQEIVEMQFRAAEKTGAPLGTPPGAPVAPSGPRAGAPAEADPLDTVTKTLQRVKRLREELAEEEEPEEYEEEEEEEEDDDEEAPEEEDQQLQENPVGWRDKLIDKAIGEGLIPLASAAASWLKAFAEQMGGGGKDGKPARPQQAPPVAPRQGQGQAVELVEDGPERAAS